MTQIYCCLLLFNMQNSVNQTQNLWSLNKSRKDLDWDNKEGSLCSFSQQMSTECILCACPFLIATDASIKKLIKIGKPLLSCMHNNYCNTKFYGKVLRHICFLYASTSVFIVSHSLYINLSSKISQILFNILIHIYNNY